jgi:hypothetical protein
MTTQHKEVAVNIQDGVIEFIYDDELAELTGEGVTSIRRVSHVEPVNLVDTAKTIWRSGSNGEGDVGWEADMSPVNGPVLGPFATRGAALTAEVTWLKTRRGL